MPELPDVVVYVERLEELLRGRRIEGVRLASPFLVRSVSPPLREAEGKRVLAVERLGKRIVLELEDALYLVFHLMIAGRFHWRAPGVPIPRKVGLVAFDFGDGSLLLTEAGSKRRASLHVIRGRAAVRELDRGGL